ncbi:hypothetical protein C6P46_000501 [Rhodotorula mucilaginosa]|uniref:C2 domain-containing protein n=1 Tax=Rhodotorula mucilaginosa TaxID=5537 RepID=A0A9P6VWQ8_RHOMI|nr:hypothetical protein C6P46_000501 [Rhodotorula mucilaginosa]
MVQVPPPPSPTSQERLLGTLIVIVLRAKNLPNRVRIGKQNPYCTITYGLHKKRTDTIERGGQQPEWDAEFRFEILKDGLGGKEQLTPESAIVTHKGGVLPAPAMAPSTSQGSDVSATGVKLEKRLSKHSLGTPVISTCAAGKRVLKVACWADDARDPKLIGEGELDIEETIQKGKYDNWVQLERKGRYAGEVYLELTWYSNEPPRPHRSRRASNGSPSRSGTAYGGAGSRVEDRSGSDTGTEEWESGAPSTAIKTPAASVVSGSTSQGRPFVPVPTELAADYPDPDVAPLTSSVSTMSLSRPPLPVPPVSNPPLSATTAASFASYQPPPPQQQYHYGAPAQHHHYGGYAPPPPPSLPPANEFGQTPLPVQEGQYGHYTYPATAPPVAPSPYHHDSAPSLHGAYAPPAVSHSPYPPPPVPPIPPTGSPYWQQPQPQQPLAGSASHGTLPHSSSQAALYAAPPPPPPPSHPYPNHCGQPSLPPPPSLGHHQQHLYGQLPPPPVPPQPPSLHQYQAAPVFSPPPPPPSLRTETPAYAPDPRYSYDPHAYEVASQPHHHPPQQYGQEQSSSGRPPLPQPPVSAPPPLSSSATTSGGPFYGQPPMVYGGQSHGQM